MWKLRLELSLMQEQTFASVSLCTPRFPQTLMGTGQRKFFFPLMPWRRLAPDNFCFHSSACSGTSGWLLAPFDPLSDSATGLSDKLHLNGGWEVTLKYCERLWISPYGWGQRWNRGPRGKTLGGLGDRQQFIWGFCSSGGWLTCPRTCPTCSPSLWTRRFWQVFVHQAHLMRKTLKYIKKKKKEILKIIQNIC